MEWKTFSWQKHVDKTRNTLFPHEVVHCGRKSVYRFGNKADIDKYLNRLLNVYKKTNAKRGRLCIGCALSCINLAGFTWYILVDCGRNGDEHTVSHVSLFTHRFSRLFLCLNDLTGCIKYKLDVDLCDKHRLEKCNKTVFKHCKIRTHIKSLPGRQCALCMCNWQSVHI